MKHPWFCRQESILSSVLAALPGLLLVCTLFLSPSSVLAQAIVSSTALVTNVPRAGINLSSEANYQPAVASNMFINPGFEFPQMGLAYSVASTTGTAFTTNETGGDLSNVWNGASAQVRVGVCSDGTNNYCWNNTTSQSTGGCSSGGSCNAGTSFTISSNSSSGGSNPETFTCSGSCPSLVAPSNISGTGNDLADVVAIHQTVSNPSVFCTATGNAGGCGSTFYGMGGWNNQSNDSTLFVTTTQAHQGQSSLEFDVPSSSVTLYNFEDPFGPIGNSSYPNVCSNAHQTICIQNSDCGGGTCLTTLAAPAHPVVGSGWQFSFWAMTTSSYTNASCSASMSRASGNTEFTTPSFNIGANAGLGWKQYSYSFTGQDTAATQTGELTFSMTCQNGVIYVDDMFVGKPATAVSGFRHEILEDLQAMNVGSLREMDIYMSSGGGVSASQMINNDYVVPLTGQFLWNGPGDNIYSYADLVGLAAAVSPATSPWLTIPMAWTDSDYTTLGGQLCSWETQYNFPAIYLECNDEDWNAPAGTNNIHGVFDPAYAMVCARAFKWIAAACSDSQLHYFFNSQTGSEGFIRSLQYGWSGFPNSSQYGASENGYTSGTINPTDTPAQIIQNFFNYGNTCGGSSNVVQGLCSGGATSGTGGDSLGVTLSQAWEPSSLCQGNGTYVPGCNQNMALYEWGVWTGGYGSDPEPQVSRLEAGWGSTGVAMQSLLLLLTTPPTAQLTGISNFFQLAQANFNGHDQWGIVPGYWGTDKDFAPVWPWLRPQGLAIELYNEAAKGDYHSISGLPSGVTGAAFNRGGTYQVALSNANPTSTSVSITFPNGTAPPTAGQTIAYSSGMTDSNEWGSYVTIGTLPGGVTQSGGQQVSFTLPALSAAVLLTPTPQGVVIISRAQQPHRQLALE